MPHRIDTHKACILQIFDSVTRLSKEYLKLCKAGCVLFNDWTAEFLCSPDPKRPVCATLEFGNGDDIPKLKVV